METVGKDVINCLSVFFNFLSLIHLFTWSKLFITLTILQVAFARVEGPQQSAAILQDIRPQFVKISSHSAINSDF